MPDGRARSGVTPLCVARSVEMVALLASYGADVNARAALAWTPLHHAANADERMAVSALLAHGADANARAAGGITPLHVATAPSIALLLLWNGADPAACADDGVPAHANMHVAAVLAAAQHQPPPSAIAAK